MHTMTTPAAPAAAHTPLRDDPPKPLTVSYSIHRIPPTPSLSLTASTDYPLDPTSTFYSALSQSVLLAQRDLNAALTTWKDAIGDAEKSKETGDAARRQPAEVSLQTSLDADHWPRTTTARPTNRRNSRTTVSGSWRTSIR